MAKKFGMTHFVNPDEVGRDKVVQAITDLTDGGADFSFECVGNVNTMRQALECCHRGWGRASSSASRPPGTEIATRPFQLVTGRVWRGSAFGGARGRTDVPKIVDWYMEGKIDIDSLITHTMPLDQINDGLRPDARGQVHPLRRGVLSGGGGAGDRLARPLLRRRAARLPPPLRRDRHRHALLGLRPAAGGRGRRRVPVVWFLSGLTCTEENFTVKAGAQRVAAELGLMLVAPDTSPRGEGVPDDPEGAYDFGLGAGFYVDATQAPWAKNYRMWSYVARELPGAGRGGAAGGHGRGRASSAIPWAGTARSRSRCATPAASRPCRPSRRSPRR